MDYDKLSKKELVKEIEDKEQIILDLQLRLESSKNNDGRKTQVLDLLKTNGSMSILEIAKELNISTKNVSSQLTYLRTDGHQIFTDPKGRKVLMSKKTEVIEDGSVEVSDPVEVSDSVE